MKDVSAFYSHMTKAALLQFEPRKAQQQSRSVATVEAIFDSTIQVLLKSGPNDLRRCMWRNVRVFLSERCINIFQIKRRCC